MHTRVVSINSPGALTEAVNILKNGGLVAFPTDTVYGLAAQVTDSQAIEQLFIVKGRDTTKAIAVLVGERAQLSQITLGLGHRAERLMERFWPGPLTLVVLRRPELPENLSATTTIGVRMPDHHRTLELLRLTGPLAVTSANLSSGNNTTTAQEVIQQLEGLIPLILDGGPTPGGRPSTVVDCTGNELVLLRQGPLVLDDLLPALGV